MTRKKIGVTGGTGFIGSYLLRDYAEKYDFVAVTSKDCSKLSTTGIEYKKIDYSEEAFVEAFAGCDVIVHLGAKVPDRVIGFGKVEDYFSNITTTQNLLNAAAKNGIKRIVDISSVAVYDKSINPLKEDFPYSPNNAYGVSKTAVEVLTEAYAKFFGFDVITLRISQVVGYRRWSHPCFFSILQEYPLENKPIPVYGTGAHTWDIIYVKDVVRGIVSAIESENAKGAYNIASGRGTSNLELAQSFIKGYKSNSKIEFITVENESTQCWWCDVSKAKKELSFECKYDLINMAADIKSEFLKNKE